MDRHLETTSVVRARPQGPTRPTHSDAEDTAPVALLCEHRGSASQAVAEVLLERGYQLRRSRNLQQTVEELREDLPDLLVLDPLSAGGTLEVEAVESLRFGESWSQRDAPVPLLLLFDGCYPGLGTAAAGCLQLPAWDLVRRDATAEEVRVRVAQLEARLEELRELERWRHRAVHDDRTGLLRPDAFEMRLHEHFAASQRHRLPLALLLLDLDSFGLINKDHDHTVGDALLERVGRAIRETLRAEDCAGRLGGDEFGVALPHIGRVDTVCVSNRLLERVRNLSVANADGEPVRITASAGFETFDGTDLDHAERLRGNAERALRQAKREGGDRCCYHRAPAPVRRQLRSRAGQVVVAD